MDSESAANILSRAPDGGKHRLALWLGIALFLLPAIGFLVLSKTAFFADDPTDGDTPIANVTFEDGFRLTVLRADLTSEMLFDCRPPFNPLRRLITRRSGSTYSTGHLMVRTAIQDGHLREASLQTTSPGPSLILLFHARNPDGSPFSDDRFFAHGEAFTIERKNGVFSKSAASGRPGESIDDLPLHLEAEDGVGGWLPFDGPIVVGEKDGRGFTALNAFPRRKPELKLRALRKGCAPVEFTVTNPGHLSTLAATTAEIPPITREQGEFKVTLQEITRSKSGTREGLHPVFLCGDPRQPRQIYTGEHEVQDSTGNVLTYRQDAGGYAPLPGEDTLRLLYRVKRNASQYPWKQTEVLMLGEARLSPDGGSVTGIRITPSGTATGITNLDASIMPATSASKETPKLKIVLAGSASPADWARTERSYDVHQIAVFWSENQAEGVSSARHSSESRAVTGPFSFDATHEWEGTLRPGESFRIGLVPKQAPVEFEFIVKVPPPFAGNERAEPEKK